LAASATASAGNAPTQPKVLQPNLEVRLPQPDGSNTTSLAVVFTPHVIAALLGTPAQLVGLHASVAACDFAGDIYCWPACLSCCVRLCW